MKKNLLLRLCLMMSLVLALYSCVHDEVYSASDPVSSEEYINKSLWKEDEKYIKNVKEVFEKYADKQYYNNTYGEVYWNYALTMGTFDETFLEVPIVKNGKIKDVLTVEKVGNKVYFRRKNDPNANRFFELLVFKKRDQLKGNMKNEGLQSKSICYTVEITWTWTNEVTGQVELVTTSSETHCSSGGGPILTDPTAPGDCLEENCTGGGGGGGYPYPETQTDPNPCNKMKEQNANQAFKDKVEELDDKKVFDKTEETGFAAAYGTHPFEPLANAANDNLKFPPGNKYFGYIHTHLDSKDGAIKIFSPADVATFLTSCVRNAQANGTMTDAYGMVITSQGNYILKYSGDGNFGIGPNQQASWQTWYEKAYGQLSPSDLANPAIIEKLFARFLIEKVKVDGLEIYKSDKTTGNTKKLEYNTTNMAVQTTTCP